MRLKNKYIVIVTTRFDAHADWVIMKLKEMGESVIRFHPEDFPRHSTVELYLEGDSFSGGFSDAHRDIHPERVKSIWWRKPKDIKPLAGLDPLEREFYLGDNKKLLAGIWNSIETYWVSKPANQYLADFRPEQLRRASQYGLRTPRTLITNNPEAAYHFFHSCNRRMITKSLHKPDYGLLQKRAVRTNELTLTYHTLTTMVSERDFETNADLIRNSPCIFQEYVEKAVELRVAIVEDDVFVGEIDSQARTETKVDWRHYEVPMRMKRGKLPDGIADRCVALMRSYGLAYSAMDFVRTPTGEHVFLENNPNGQWLFMEQYDPRLKITEALCRRLVNGGNR